MNKTILALVLSGAAIFSASSFAQTERAGGVINITGAISDTTCTINGGKSADFTVPLAPISIEQAGVTVGLIKENAKTIKLSFSNCTPATGDGNLKMSFSSESTISNDGKYLINTSADENGPDAKHVGFALTKDNALVPLDKALDTGVKGNTETPEELILGVNYYKPDAVPAVTGPLASTVTYTVSYN